MIQQNNPLFRSGTELVEARVGVAPRKSVFGFVLAFVVFVSAHAGNTQTAKEKVRVALGSISVNSSIIPIGQEAGLFSKHGLDIEPIYFGGMNSLAAVTSNSVQFLAAGSTATISARLGGI